MPKRNKDEKGKYGDRKRERKTEVLYISCSPYEYVLLPVPQFIISPFLYIYVCVCNTAQLFLHTQIHN
jgi:hypothetical protein